VNKTLISAAIAAAFAVSFAANAQNVSEGEIDQTTGQPRNQQQGGQANTNELKDPATTQAQPQDGQSGQATGESSDQGAQRRPAEGPAQGQGPQPDHSTTGETTGQGQGVKDSGGEAAAGTHQDQGGDPTRGSGNTTGATGAEQDSKRAQ